MTTKMTKLSVLAFLGLSLVVYGQSGKVGINTDRPAATLEIKPSTTNLTGTTNEGLLIPRLDRERVKAMGTNPEESTLVYIESLGGTQDGTVENVDAVGFYYFVKGTTNKWVKQGVEPWKVYGTDKQATLNTQNIYQKGNVVVTHKDIPTYFLNMGEESGEVVNWGMKSEGKSFSTYGEQMALDGTFFAKHYGQLSGSTLSLVSRGKNNGPSIATTARIVMGVGGEDSSKPYDSFLIYKYGGDQYNEDLVIDGAYLINNNLYGNTLAFLQDGSFHFRNKGNYFAIGKDNTSLSILKNGNVGVGIEEPTEKLEVIGNIKASSLVGQGNRTLYADANGVIKVGSTAYASASLWSDDAANNKVVLAANSNVTIDKTSGELLAGSFKGVNGATIFPDYVFQKYYTGTSSLKADYSFKTLSQVEDFVKTNGHLPGYQSAEAIKKQGYIDLMATQLTNVEKIEELYLHSIEQDKALKAKDAKIAELEARLQKLEALLVK